MGAIINLLSTILGPIINIFNKRQADVTQENQQNSDNANAQIAVNQVEAANPHLFVSGWRPFIGWGLGIAVIYALAVHPVLSDIFYMFTRQVLPAIDITAAGSILGALLGVPVIVARSIEKLKGVTK